MKRNLFLIFAVSLFIALALAGCGDNKDKQASSSGERDNNEPGGKKLTIGVAMESLESQFWVSNFEAIKDEAKTQGIEIIEAIANGDQNKQNQQIENFISRKVDAIIVSPKDNAGIVAAIKKANEAGIPVITNNRAAAEGAKVGLDVTSDSYSMAKKEAEWLVEFAKSNNIKFKALVFVGDLKDVNAKYRDDGFTEVAEANKDYIEIVTKVPTEWKPEKALAGTINSLQANPDVNLIYTPSDFLLPSIVSGMQQSKRWFKDGEEGHIHMATFDGAQDALDYLKDGYVDIVAVQDAQQTGIEAVRGAVKLAKSEKVEPIFKANGFMVTKENFSTEANKAWGYAAKK